MRSKEIYKQLLELINERYSDNNQMLRTIYLYVVYKILKGEEE